MSVSPEPVPSAVDDYPEDPRFRTMRRLVNALLMVLIAGVCVIVIAIGLRLKNGPAAAQGVAARTPGESVAAVEATAERIAITLRDARDGSERVVILDGRTFRLIGEIGAPVDQSAPR